mmetsp:Transcript_1606/g.3084  ORF Transcript_1606/g.3084 Transcript_1606/m.3084 type:complete len:131 (-) Transcript_1606:265-657(-)|eukprot:CAMPEP_0167786590 /NCGR_PEP_ID=MMETSP0111_2-20121227/8886_1 /TAXON_ID=91324 /ORGANISM="Lotharella globosa, Strain CCCM811" /LENGTH=130 /DNA_ID=CAMNT_0007678007 /DNA_START=62 /DNA_END=454 /DNA_ORIENTATION=+
MAFRRPVNYDSFYLLPTTVNARAGMRYAPGELDLSVAQPGTSSTLSAKAKSFVPKFTSRERSPASSEASFSSSQSFPSPEASPAENPRQNPPVIKSVLSGNFLPVPMRPLTTEKPKRVMRYADLLKKKDS